MIAPSERATTALGPTQVRVGIIDEVTGKVASWHTVASEIILRDHPVLGRTVAFTEGPKDAKDENGNAIVIENRHIVSAPLVKVRTWDENYYGERINRSTRSVERYLNEREG